MFDVLADTVCVANDNADCHHQHHRHCFTEHYADTEPNSHAIRFKHTTGDPFPNAAEYFERHTDDLAEFVAVAESKCKPTGIPECEPHDIADNNQQPSADRDCNFKLHTGQLTIWDLHRLSDIYGLAIRDPN